MRCAGGIRALISISLVLAATACTPASKSSVLGVWYETDGSQSLEFLGDGRLAIRTPTQQSTGRWISLQDGRIRIELTASGTTGIIIGRLEGDDLIMRVGDLDSRYARVMR